MDQKAAAEDVQSHSPETQGDAESEGEAQSPSTGADKEAQTNPKADANTGSEPNVDEDSESGSSVFQPLTDAYEHLRHTDDSAELSAFARRPLPDRSDQAAYSRVTALLEAVAGNNRTPEEDRVFLAETMPFPNILVKLSADPCAAVREAVAKNEADKNWLVGRLTKDADPAVRSAALRNPQTTWKMRLEGGQNPEVDEQTLDFLGQLGVELESDAPVVLSSMVRRAVALNHNSSRSTLERLAKDPSGEVARAAQSRLAG
ncbi:AbrB family transcriptional regulator [Bifidobacterium aemilianum]|uniref:AbrB family transcriptional regulator n=1 Tax=Bifidobacterium aemilianum TaxID=2493120 RepID=UPI0038B2F0F9